MSDLDHPFRWYATVRQPATGKVWKYQINGSQQTREDVAEFIAAHYVNVEMVSCDLATRMHENE